MKQTQWKQFITNRKQLESYCHSVGASVSMTWTKSDRGGKTSDHMCHDPEFFRLILKSLSLVSSVSLHFLSLCLSALFPPVWLLAPPSLCPPVSRSPVSNHLHLPCVFKPCLSHSPALSRMCVWSVLRKRFCGMLLAFGSYLSLATTAVLTIWSNNQPTV